MNHRVVLLALCVGLLMVGTASAFDWLDGWDYRQVSNVTGNVSWATQTDYQIMYVVYTGAGTSSGQTLYLKNHAQPDLDDLRFTNVGDPTDIYDYWIEGTSSPYNVWVEVPTLTNGTNQIAVYYGNLSATAYSNGDATFPVFDDFTDATYNTSKWRRWFSGGTTNIIDGIVHSYGGSSAWEGLGSYYQRSYPYAARYRMNMTEVATSVIVVDQRTATGVGSNWSQIVSASPTDLRYTTRESGLDEASARTDVLNGTMSIVEFRQSSGASTSWYINDVLKKTHTTRVPESVLGLGWAANGASALVRVDWALFRSYIEPEPTYTAWSAEEVGIDISWYALPLEGDAPLTVTFFDTSTLYGQYNVSYYLWKFGDGVSIAGVEYKNVTHTYTTAPYKYDVTHIFGDAYQYPDYIKSETRTDYINVTVNTDIPSADFTVTETCGDTTDTFYFIDFSTGGGLYAWNWSFGDGNYSELRNPTHQYSANGTYNVSLFVEGAYGNDTLTKTDYIAIPCGATPPSTPPVANFTSNVTTGSIYPLVVQFTDTSSASPTSWNWSFGDGRYSESQHPIYQYAVAGKYNVSLNATNADGTNTTTKTEYINLTSDVDDYLISWLHMNGSTGSTTFTDERGNNWIPSGAVQLTELIKYFGTASGDYSGTKPYIYTPSSTTFNFSSNDFTIEVWVNVTSTGNGYPIIQRGNSVLTTGWGLYHSTSSSVSDAWKFYMGSYLSNSTGIFTLVPNKWNHLVVTRESGTVKIYVNGSLQSYMSDTGYNFDTINPIYLGYNPNKYFNGYIDEFRISNGIARWKANFTTPYAEYRGTLETIYPDINPNSTLRYKTSPSSYATIANQTNDGTRNRTLLLENVYNTSYIVAAVAYDPLYTFPLNVNLNTTIYSTNMTLISSNINTESSIVEFNISRILGFNNGTIAAPIVDIQYLYYNYTSDPFTLTSFAYGHLINGTTFQSYPIHNFITTNMSLMDWNFTGDFSANTTTQTTGGTIVFNSSFVGAYPNAYNWSWGDGNFTYSSSPNATHSWSTNGLKTITLTQYLWQNASIQNITTKTDYINITGENITPTPTVTPTPTTTSSSGYNMSTGLSYETEDIFIPFWFWAVMIIIASILLIIGVFSDTVVFSMVSFMIYITMAYASPTVGFFYNELVLTNSSTNEYSMIPIVFQIIPPWMSYVLVGFAIISMLHIWSGVISWLDARKMESYQNETVRIRFEEQEEEED